MEMLRELVGDPTPEQPTGKGWCEVAGKIVPIYEAKLVMSGQARGGSGFAHRVDTGEATFVPTGVMETCKLRVGDVFYGRLKPQPWREHQEKRPWVCVYASLDPFEEEVTEPVVPDNVEPEFAFTDYDTMKQRVREWVLAGEARVWTSKELTAKLIAEGGDPRSKEPHNAATNALRDMFKEGRVQQWLRYKKYNQERASEAYYSAHPDLVELQIKVREP